MDSKFRDSLARLRRISNRKMHKSDTIYYLIQTRNTTNPESKEDVPVPQLWALVQEVVEHGYLVRRCAFPWDLIFRQKELYHEEDKDISAVAAVAADDR